MKLQQFVQMFIFIRSKRKIKTKITNSKYLLTNKEQLQVKRQMQCKKHSHMEANEDVKHDILEPKQMKLD